MSSLLRFAALAASLAVAVPVLAQSGTSKPADDLGKTVEGDTPDRVSLVNSCEGHKFESLVEIDAVKHRSTRVKLCAKPGSTDADWVRTLHSAIAQFELRNMPPAARDQLIAELQVEAAKYDKTTPGAKTSITGVSGINLGKGSFSEAATEPEAPFRVASLPPLPTPKGLATRSTAKSVKPIRVTVKCLSRGESGKGATCDFFDRNTTLVLTAISGLDDGATIRFLRKGEEHGTVDFAALSSGQSRRVALPSDVCRSISYSKIDIELIAPKATTPGGRLGPYGLRC